jgi:class 3 adenylate cyclase
LALRRQAYKAEKVRALGLEVRNGLHTGEIELAGDDIRGTVHIGARAAALAGRGEVFATSTVKDLVAGSGIEFDDRGEHALKGVPGDWRIFLVTSA